MNKLTLSIADRLQLVPLLPAQGGRVEMITVDAIAGRIDLSTSEVENVGVKDIPGGVTFDPKNSYDTDYELSNAEISILKKMADDLDRQGRISRAMLPLMDKIDALKHV